MIKKDKIIQMSIDTLNGVKPMEINIGITEEHREKIAEGLSRVLADSYLLY